MTINSKKPGKSRWNQQNMVNLGPRKGAFFCRYKMQGRGINLAFMWKVHKKVQKSASPQVKWLIFRMGIWYDQNANFVDRNRCLRIKYKRYYCL